MVSLLLLMSRRDDRNAGTSALLGAAGPRRTARRDPPCRESANSGSHVAALDVSRVPLRSAAGTPAPHRKLALRHLEVDAVAAVMPAAVDAVLVVRTVEVRVNHALGSARRRDAAVLAAGWSAERALERLELARTLDGNVERLLRAPRARSACTRPSAAGRLRDCEERGCDTTTGHPSGTACPSVDRVSNERTVQLFTRRDPLLASSRSYSSERSWFTSAMRGRYARGSSTWRLFFPHTLQNPSDPSPRRTAPGTFSPWARRSCAVLRGVRSRPRRSPTRRAGSTPASAPSSRPS